MQPRIPRQSARDDAAHAMDDDAGLSAELAAALAGARRRAVRDGDRQIDTAHLLHSLLEYDPQVRAAFDDGPQLARLLGYLVQRSIGYGLRWQSGVEDSGALPVFTAVEGFSPLASAALEHARVRAARRDGDRARGADLLAAIVADPEARAVEVLTRAGVDARQLRVRVEDGPQRCERHQERENREGYEEREECVGGGEAAH
ncbi:Clp protease N-terminal domain-containing protein [Streptomyces sp. NPDC006527]|uniref:Clp protease N-terminal domain-containing protein n=1 Tax=Streptomyces sp. NPDC006527 TaxID=3364749 RepID=UPI00369A5444